MKSVISDNKIIPFLPCYKRTSQLHETKVSDLKTVYGCNGYAVYDYIENVLKLKIQSSHRTIRADVPTEKEQKYLKIDRYLPVLEVEQVAFLSNGQAFEYSISRHRSDKAEFKMINIKE